MNERVRPCNRKVDTLGVAAVKKGIGDFILDNVMVDGVLVVVVGEGGNTNNVCEGVEMAGGGTAGCCCVRFTFFSKLLRKVSGGGASFRGAARARGVAELAVNFAFVPDFDGTRGASSEISVTGDDGTGERTLMGGGRRFIFVTFGWARSKLERLAVAGGGGRVNESFQTGADGSGRKPGNLPARL